MLINYMPEASVAPVIARIYEYRFLLKITRPRSTKFADYRPPVRRTDHLITINNDLNPYAFLITLLHEMAHLVTWEKYGNRVKSHGKEWKAEYTTIITAYLEFFPDGLKAGLVKHFNRPKASSCSDPGLMRLLRTFDREDGSFYLEELEKDALFRLSNQKVFRKGDKLRKRYACQDMATGRKYLVSGVAKVWAVEESAEDYLKSKVSTNAVLKLPFIKSSLRIKA